MFLKRLVFINWGNIPNGEFELGPVNLFSGANGSGKTTAADAIQTIMTAAHENLFHFNPGQEETTQRGRGGKRVRTLASYVLGCDDGSYARTEATDGYLAATFHPTEGESAEPFTAVVAVRAWLDASGKQALAREEQLLFFVVVGADLDVDIFVHERSGGRQVLLLEDLQVALVTRFGKRAVERYDQKRAYLRRLYGALRGKRDSVAEREAIAAARAFSRFMAYKPVSGIHQFVTEEVLERKDLGEAIRSVSSQLKIIHEMEHEAQTLKDSALLLEQAGHRAQAYIETWLELITLDYTRAQAEYFAHQQRYLEARQRKDAIELKLKENAQELTVTDERRTQIHSTLVTLEAQRQGIRALQEKDALEAECAALEAALRESTVELLSQDRQLQENLRSVRALSELLIVPTIVSELPEVTGLHSQQLVRQAQEMDKAGDLDLPRLLQRDFTGDLAMLEKHLDDARQVQRVFAELTDYWTRREPDGRNRRDAVGEVDHRRRQRYDQLTNQLQQKQQEIARLEAKQVLYPPYVDRALAAIRTQCPQADARVLCDHIEVIDPHWQSAIEGYMGGARFGIIVDADYEAHAIRIVRSLAGRDNRARVLQGARALRDAARLKPLPDSIVHVLKFTHAVAQAFVVASYGTVVRVATAEDLRQTPRGVTADGMGSGNYAMFRSDIADADLVFGAAARERALRARHEELEQLIVARQQANERMQESARLLNALNKITALTYADVMTRFVAQQREIRKTEMLLQQLDISEFQSLDAQLADLRREERTLDERRTELNQQTGGFTTQLADVARSIERLSEQKDAAQTAMAAAEDSVRATHADWPEFDLNARLQYAEQEARSFDSTRAQVERSSIENRLHKLQHDLNDRISHHNQKCRAADAVVYTAFTGSYDHALFERICELRREIDRVFNILRNNVLVEKHERLKALKQSFNNAFVSHLCQEIYQAILDGKRQLDLLNKELINHRFGSDREQFRFAQEWVPEYREYWRFFEEVVKSPALGQEATLFDAQLSPKSSEVRDALMALLLGADEQRSHRDLERIADYRNYHRYEIYKDVEGKPPIALSEYGTGSGGQLETPAYIIRAASITSALRYAEGANHLRMVLVDEAFSKMDETRSREVIDYLTRSLGLQLVFIMPTSKCGPFMDLVSNEFVFAKVPSAPRGQLQTRVLVDRKQCNQPRIVELWARHRRTVHQQAELEFMTDVLEQEAADNTAARR